MEASSRGHREEPRWSKPVRDAGRRDGSSPNGSVSPFSRFMRVAIAPCRARPGLITQVLFDERDLGLNRQLDVAKCSRWQAVLRSAKRGGGSDAREDSRAASGTSGRACRRIDDDDPLDVEGLAPRGSTTAPEGLRPRDGLACGRDGAFDLVNRVSATGRA
jgi:hypothetical protein